MSLLRKLENEKKTSFYVQPKWSSTSFQMTIIEGPNAWHSNITEEKLKGLADERQKNKDEYYKEVKESINNGTANITYDIKKNGSTCQFLIYRKMGNSKINYFISDLDKVDYQTCVFDLIDEVDSKNLELVELLRKSEENKRIAYDEKELVERKLQEFVESKTNWEKEMYSNFLLLLNEKKKRISFLTGLLRARKIDADGAESEATEKTEEAVSDSESNETSPDYETDDDDDDGGEKYEIQSTQTQPSTSAFSNLLKPDSPPPLLLPKRIRRDDNTKESAPAPLMISATQTSEVKKKKDESKEKKKAPEPKITEENTLTFTTQDLLDRM